MSEFSGIATTLCSAWRLRLKDGSVRGLTDHDQSFELDGTTYHPSQSLNETDRDHRINFAADGGEIETVFDLPDLTEEAVKEGVLDNAILERFTVNWQNPSEYKLTSSGRIGRVKISGDGFQAEWLGHATLLERGTGRVFGKICDASFGDARCGVDAGLYPEGTICPRSFAACRDQFSNTANFRGFPFLLGDDALQAAPQDGERRDGGSRYAHLKLHAQ